jgi:hypothetical protein
LHRLAASAKLASTQNRFTAGRAAFVSASQLADASTQNALHYDEGASGRSFDKETNLNDNWIGPTTRAAIQKHPWLILATGSCMLSGRLESRYNANC